MNSAGSGGAQTLQTPASSHRGFDGIMTPQGMILLTFALALVILICVIGGLAWRVMMRRDREIRAAKRAELAAQASSTSTETPNP